jgi:poly-gamma-glutamate synthesis protein (capsule biosynthesis protein)
MNKKVQALIVLSLFLLAAASGVFLLGPLFFQKNNHIPPDLANALSPPKTEPAYVDIDIACVGDILMHLEVVNSYRDTDYDFRPIFTHVKPILEKADLTIANLEVSLGGPSLRYSGYPMFNTPDTIADALKDAGVNVIANANNHCMDTGENGFYRTIDTVREKGMEITGTRKTEQERPYVIKDIKGVRFGIISFGYGSYISTGVNINGLPMPQSMSKLLNFIDYSRLDTELEKLHTLVSAARAEEAQIIIAVMHWGEEYETRSRLVQQRVAKELAELKVDIVFGGHPHVIQEAAFVSAETSDHQTLVYYSLGNFISNQRLETLNNVNTEHGLIAQVTMRYHEDGRIEMMHSGYTATWVNRKQLGAKRIYEIIPATQALNEPGKFPNIVQADTSRLATCQSSVDKLMANIMD